MYERYPVIEFEIENLFMLGSPTGIFLTARGADYPIRLPKCANLYNIYNPNDPVVFIFYIYNILIFMLLIIHYFDY